MPEVEKLKPYGGDDRTKDRQVASMFDAIAPAYDFMNGAMSLGMHKKWQRRLVEEICRRSPGIIVDLATGTGEVALALHRALPQARIAGLDISEGMLALAREKDGAAAVDFRCADALATGLPEGSVDAVTIAYGVRNFADIPGGLREMARILRPGGVACVLELSEPANAVVRAGYRLYTRTLVPLVGRMVSGDSRAYTYLPLSIAACPQRADMTALMLEAGFARASWRSFCMGACTLYTAER